MIMRYHSAVGARGINVVGHVVLVGYHSRVVAG